MSCATARTRAPCTRTSPSCGFEQAIEWKGEDWFCVGVQWHPHKEGTVSLDMQLIEAFVNAAAKAAVSTKPKLSLAKAG